MLSYLSNRHYHLLTKEFPEELKIDQPKVVYLPAHNGLKKSRAIDKKPTNKLKLKRSKQMVSTSAIGDWYSILHAAAPYASRLTTFRWSFTARSMSVSNAGS
jgi:hypothetical protein